MNAVHGELDGTGVRQHYSYLPGVANVQDSEFEELADGGIEIEAGTLDASCDREAELARAEEFFQLVADLPLVLTCLTGREADRHLAIRPGEDAKRIGRYGERTAVLHGQEYRLLVGPAIVYGKTAGEDATGLADSQIEVLRSKLEFLSA